MGGLLGKSQDRLRKVVEAVADFSESSRMRTLSRSDGKRIFPGFKSVRQ